MAATNSSNFPDFLQSNSTDSHYYNDIIRNRHPQITAKKLSAHLANPGADTVYSHRESPASSTSSKTWKNNSLRTDIKNPEGFMPPPLPKKERIHRGHASPNLEHDPESREVSNKATERQRSEGGWNNDNQNSNGREAGVMNSYSTSSSASPNSSANESNRRSR